MNYFCQKSSIIGVRLGAQYAFDIQKSLLLLHKTAKEDGTVSLSLSSY